MKYKALAFFGVILLFSAVVTWAEDASPPKPASLKLPKGNGEWAIQIRRTGGIADLTMEMTIFSDGRVQCDPPDAR